MQLSTVLLFLYIVVSQHAFLTVISDSSQLPSARMGDLGMFFLIGKGDGLQGLRHDVQYLVPGEVVLYKTNESENGLKLATVMRSTGTLPQSNVTPSAVLHHDMTFEALVANNSSEDETRSLGVLLRRWSDECGCAEAYDGLARDFVKPVSDIHGYLGVSVPLLGMPILLLHRIKIFFAGSGIAGGLASLSWSVACGRHVTLYDLDLETRTGPVARRRNLVYAFALLFTVIAYVVYQLAVIIVGVTCTTIFGIFLFLNAGLHDVAFDAAAWLRDVLGDEVAARVAGPTYFGWPIRDRQALTLLALGGALVVQLGPGRALRCTAPWRQGAFYEDDLSFSHALGEGLSTVGSAATHAPWSALNWQVPVRLADCYPPERRRHARRSLLRAGAQLASQPHFHNTSCG